MLTLGQALFFAVIFGVILCIVAGLICWNMGFKFAMSGVAVKDNYNTTVTVFNADTQEFVQTIRFNTIYESLLYISQYNTSYDLQLKTRKPSGEYVTLYLICTGVGA